MVAADALARLRVRLAAEPAAEPEPPPCAHRGEPTGESLPCGACGGAKRAAAVHACARHGRCTTTKLFAGVVCCKECDDRLPPGG